MNFLEINHSSNPRTRSSYENEWKGLLFEYLVARSIAEKYSITRDFHNTLSSNLLDQLDRYQKWLYQSSPQIYDKLKIWPQVASHFFHQKFLNEKIKSISIGDKTKTLEHEGDIFIKTESKSFWISLKLAKINSFINTKSGGIKSFLNQYFPGPITETLQNELNQQAEIDFFNFAKDLHHLRNIPFSGNFQNWKQAQLPELPGELLPEEHVVFSQFMVKQVLDLKEKLKEIYQNNPDKFLSQLRSLMGTTQLDIIPFYMYHDRNDLICFMPDYESQISSSFLWKDDSGDIFSFSLEFDQFELQIRLKPMNKFTAPSPKVNCSVKWKVFQFQVK